MLFAFGKETLGRPAKRVLFAKNSAHHERGRTLSLSARHGERILQSAGRSTSNAGDASTAAIGWSTAGNQQGGREEGRRQGFPEALARRLTRRCRPSPDR
jgi:hypothetical protein